MSATESIKEDLQLPKPHSTDDTQMTDSTDDTKVTDSTDTIMTDSKPTHTQPKAIGKKRKREKTRWGAPPRKKRWGNKKPSANTSTSLISSLLKMSGTAANKQTLSNAMFGKAWNETQTKIFLLKNQLQDVSTRLIAPSAFIAADALRSPSPEPVYDQKGVRVNTREFRLKDKLQKQRIDTISKIIAIDPNYQPPSDYKAPKLTHKILMPVDDYPDYNFFGLIVGPRGNTQKEMQKETGCKIAVRGQGACLDKPGRVFHPDDNDPLHVHITAPNQASLDKATAMIEALLTEVRDGTGEHKAKQLRELATINGTLRIEQRCRICGGQHPLYRCPDKTGEKWTPAQVQCSVCGELTHVTEDCKHFKKGRVAQQSLPNARQSIDAEYRSFMQELVGDGPMSSNRPIAAITAPPPKNGTTINVNGYHCVPPPSQSGAIAPNAAVTAVQSGMPMMGMPMPMMPPMGMGMPMVPMMGMGGFGMGMGMGMGMNPYMRPPMPMGMYGMSNPLYASVAIPPPPPPPPPPPEQNGKK